MEQRIEGTVKRFWSDRGYGFVARDDGQDIFVAQRELRVAGIEELKEGERVSFEVGTQRDGRTFARSIMRANAGQVLRSAPRYGNPLAAG